jgi:hypothetical protein
LRFLDSLGPMLVTRVFGIWMTMFIRFINIGLKWVTFVSLMRTRLLVMYITNFSILLVSVIA